MNFYFNSNYPSQSGNNRHSHQEDLYCERSRRHRSRHAPHKRSSSTSNFSASSYGQRRPARGHNSHSRSASNRSLNLPGGNDCLDNTGDEYNSACEFEDERTCSSCSFSSSSSATSTDSESDEFDDDGFGGYARNYRAAIVPAQQQQPPLARSSNSASRMAGAQDTFQRKYNSGLKISYVDNLPLARTNPAPEQKKAKKASGSSKKNKSISKFKKDNCTVS